MPGDGHEAVGRPALDHLGRWKGAVGIGLQLLEDAPAVGEAGRGDHDGRALARHLADHLPGELEPVGRPVGLLITAPLFEIVDRPGQTSFQPLLCHSRAKFGVLVFDDPGQKFGSAI